jgi:hypothetical protein
MTGSKLFLKISLVTALVATLSISTGCSAWMKWGYAAPAGGDKWTENSKSSFRNLPPTFSYQCDAISIEAVPAVIYDYVYSVGPAFLPVIPFFNFGGNDNVKDNFSILLRLSPKEMVKKQLPSGDDINISITANGNTFKPGNIRVYENSSQYVFVNTDIKADLNSMDSFMLNFHKLLDRCTIAPLRFEKMYKTRLEAFP